MMTPSRVHDDDTMDDTVHGGRDRSGAPGSGDSATSYVALTRHQRSLHAPTSICSAMTELPMLALQRMLGCFALTPTVRMQSGRTVALGAEIAQGGYSYVYHARDTSTGEHMALKKILCQTEEQVQMAKREIEMHRSFLHPNIMPLSDFAVVSIDTYTFEYYLLFPFIENGTLREMIDIALLRRMPIPERLIMDMFLKICRAVGELHARSPPLAHRDIKPENVLLTRDNEPILTDFGSVTVADVSIASRSDALALQDSAAQFSSMSYRAPELYDVGDLTHVSSVTDVWSLGCLLYAMGFGYSPFECTFSDNGDVRITECSYLAVIGHVKFPKSHNRTASFVELISVGLRILFHGEWANGAMDGYGEKEVPLQNSRHARCDLFHNLPLQSDTVAAMNHMSDRSSSSLASGSGLGSGSERRDVDVDGATASPSSPSSSPEGSTRCDCCKSCGAILELDGCGHRFHPRCIYAYPMRQCELCSTPVTAVKIFRVFKNAPNSMVRKGKWSPDEHKYANMMMKQFQLGAFPLVDGLHLRGFIANLLQCDPLRVTKKYSGHAIGKQNFYYQRQKSYCYNLHTKLQKRISNLRNHFYWHIQFRCKFGYSINIQELKAAEADYWIREFLKFADKIGQRVEFQAPSPSPPMTPVQTPTEEPLTQSQSSQPVALSSPARRTEPEVFSPPLVESEPAAPLAFSSRKEQQQPSFKLRNDASGSLSPLSFDEWNEDSSASFMDMLDGAVLDDFARHSAQLSISLSDFLAVPAKMSSSYEKHPSGAKPSAVAAAAETLAPPSSSSSSQRTKCSLGEWLREEESRWNDSMTATSWSFSLTLSDCA
ncbi:hypothetical protein P43SY_002848 [Pythium insidiosum]|uniref:Protein kinase domain-containing protein n=1 Tax=Pythium insidiosum TaxID=114742 RepID=A0AAD5M905_PYTIN|nr:hypothetical protein P43SY_002848 [Pythium insidiosum]